MPSASPGREGVSRAAGAAGNHGPHRQDDHRSQDDVGNGPLHAAFEQREQLFLASARHAPESFGRQVHGGEHGACYQRHDGQLEQRRQKIEHPPTSRNGSILSRLWLRRSIKATPRLPGNEMPGVANPKFAWQASPRPLPGRWPTIPPQPGFDDGSRSCLGCRRKDVAEHPMPRFALSASGPMDEKGGSGGRIGANA